MQRPVSTASLGKRIPSPRLLSVTTKAKASKQATVYYDTVDHGRDFKAYRFKQAARRQSYWRGLESQFSYLKDLKSDTNYYFIVKDHNSISPRFFFRTAPSTQKAFRFIAGGDSRSSSKNRQKSNILVPKIRPLFILFTGDFTGAGTKRQWEAWLKDWQLTHSSDGRMYPIIPVRGNHDRQGAITALFGLEDPKEYFSLSFADKSLLLYSLNTQVDLSGEQKQWLLRDLQKNAQTHRYVAAGYHRPIRPHMTQKPEGIAQYEHWAPIFYKYKFDLLFEADSHCVKRTARVKPSTAAGSDEGFIRAHDGFFMSGEGCWGAPLRLAQDKKSWTLDTGRFNSFDIIDVFANKMELRTVNSDTSKMVEELTEAHKPFALPKNLKLWKPKSGTVLEIPVRKK